MPTHENINRQMAFAVTPKTPDLKAGVLRRVG